MTPFPFAILTPAGPAFSGEALFVGACSIEGSLGVLARHAPMIVTCPAGAVRVQRADGWLCFDTSAAILRTDGRAAVVLAARAEPAADEAAALQAARDWERREAP